MKILECSSKGDKRFSAFYAVVEVLGKKDSIENHYQLSKRFGDAPAPLSWRDSKGKKPSHFVIGEVKYPLEQLALFYDLLWKKYLDNHPELVEFLENYDDYKDSFARPGCNNQADSIRKYMENRKREIK